MKNRDSWRITKRDRWLFKFLLWVFAEFTIAVLGGLGVAFGLGYIAVTLGWNLPSKDVFEFAFVALGMLVAFTILLVIHRKGPTPPPCPGRDE